MDLIVWVADVESIRNEKFGWCRSCLTHKEEIKLALI